MRLEKKEERGWRFKKGKREEVKRTKRVSIKEREEEGEEEEWGENVR